MKYQGNTISEIPIAGHYYTMVMEDESSWDGFCEDFQMFRNGTVMKCTFCKKFNDNMIKIMFEGMKGPVRTDKNSDDGTWNHNINSGDHWFVEMLPVYKQEELEV